MSNQTLLNIIKAKHCNVKCLLLLENDLCIVKNYAVSPVSRFVVNVKVKPVSPHDIIKRRGWKSHSGAQMYPVIHLFITFCSRLSLSDPSHTHTYFIPYLTVINSLRNNGSCLCVFISVPYTLDMYCYVCHCR